MEVCILGADGYYGRALANRLQDKHDLLLLDNFVRRNNPDYPSITPLPEPSNIICADATNFTDLHKHFSIFKPDAVIHLAEQRSAPYSMISYDTKLETLNNNMISSFNIMELSRIFDFHTIHIGTMGVYGYDKDGEISEGDLHRAPGSIYHLSKCVDNNIFEFYGRMYDRRITELHQGIIWGIGGRFDYDAVYGTVINRFIAQKMTGYPLTLYGTGEQERAIINIENSLDCIELVLYNETPGMRTFNQYTQIMKLKDIAEIVNFKSQCIDNPRKEVASNTLLSTNKTLLGLGLNPIVLTSEKVDDMIEQLMPFKNKINTDLFVPRVKW